MCDEINQQLPLLIPHANGLDTKANVPQWNTEFNGERVKVLNPRIAAEKGLNLLRFMGVLMGIAVRNSVPIKLRMAPIIWKQIAGEPSTAGTIVPLHMLTFRLVQVNTSYWKTLSSSTRFSNGLMGCLFYFLLRSPGWNTPIL